MITADSVWVFDLDGTLAESKQPITPTIAEMLTNLTKLHRVAILSGATLGQIQTQVLDLIPDTPITVYACAGATYQRPNQQPVTSWIPEPHRLQIMEQMEAIVKLLGFWELNPVGDIIEDRQSQITFSALGQHAYPEQKAAWDADKTKRKTIIKHLTPYLKLIGDGQYTAHLGGSTSIDVTRHTKREAITLIAEHHQVEASQIIYVGDDFGADGNDYPVLATEAQCVNVRNWLHTNQIVKQAIGQIP